MSSSHKNNEHITEMSKTLKVTKTISVSPSPSLPIRKDETLALSCLDNDLNLRRTFRTLRFFSPSLSNSNDPFHVLISSLAKALFHFYPLAGRLLLLPDGRIAVQCGDRDTVDVVLAECELWIAEAEVLEPGSELLNRLAPDFEFDFDRVESVRTLGIQVTRFSCGGFSFGMCVHHALCDGAGATKFLSAVAQFAHNEHELKVEPVWDRLSLLGPRTPPHVETDLGEFLEFGVTGLHEDVDKTCLKECFHISNTCLNQFREQLKEEAGLSFTAFEALGAFIWRARVKANNTASEEMVKIAYSMNIAKVLNPELPSGYWGNVCVPVYVQQKARDLIQQPISLTAELIKKSKYNVTEEYVKSYIDFQELHHSKKISAGEFVSGFTDWRHLGHSEVDFGWGSPRVVLPLSWRILGSMEPTFFLPYDNNDVMKKEGFKVLVCLREKAMELFRKEINMFDNLIGI